MRRAYIYVRVSTEDQRDNYSVAGQETACREFCQRQGYDPVRVWKDEAASAKTFDRPAWSAMQASVKRDKIDFIVVQKYDRFSRNVAEGLEMFERLERRYGVRVISVSENYGVSPHSPMFWKLRADALMSAHFERIVIADRTAGGRHTAAKQGRWIGPAPFGYDNARDERNKPILTVNVAEAATVREMFTQAASGMALPDVRSWGKLNGFTGKHKEAVKRLLTNPVYAGLILTPAYQGQAPQYVTGLHDPIVSETVFWQVQKILAGKAPTVRQQRDENLPLRGVVLCQSCHKPLTGSRSRGKSGGHWYYYRCLRCTGQNYRAETAHGELREVLTGLSFTPEQITFLHQETERKVREKLGEQKRQAQAARAEIIRLETLIESLEGKYIADRIDEETYHRWNTRYQSERGRLTDLIAQAENNEAAVWNRFSAALPFLGDLAAVWDICPAPEKARYLRLIFLGGLEKTDGGYRTPEVLPGLSHNLHRISILQIKNRTENAHFDASGPVRSPYGTKIEPSGAALSPLIDFLVQLKRA